MNKTSIGAEIELSLINQNGIISNNAPHLLKNEKAKGWLVYEGTHAQVEINSSPTWSVKELHEDLSQKIQKLEDICNDYSSKSENTPIFPVTVSEFGAGNGEINQNIERLKGYRKVIGEDSLAKLVTNSGIHLHIQKDEKRSLDQFKLLHALDPLSYAITSTSPITHEGTNNLNCHRINTTRYLVFKDFPLSAQLQDYPQGILEIEDRTDQTYKYWLNKALRNGLKEQKFKKHFKPETTGYAPIRDRPNFDTWEVRSFDTTPLDIALGAIALYKGINDYLLKNEVELEISNKDYSFDFSENKFTLPNYKTLILMEQEAINYGLKENPLTKKSLVLDYLNQILPFSKLGLSQEDQIYLKTIEDLIETRANLADQIMDYLKLEQNYETGNKVNFQQAQAANLFMREKYLSGIDRARSLANYNNQIIKREEMH